MRKSIDIYVQSIIHDNEQFINESGCQSIADYIISSAESGNGFYEFFDDAEFENNCFEPTNEQIEELKNYLTENYNYLPE